MKAVKWEKLEHIFHAAIGLPFGERQPFLAHQCGGDRELLSEVESLLENFEGKPEFLDKPVFELGLGAIHQSAEKNLSGSTIGVYEVKEKIGAGGMGEVYKALDTNLNRTVALKFLPETLKHDAAAKRRLAREAQAAAALEHPNICTVYGFEQTDDHHFIVMQCVEGKTLSERFEDKRAGVEEFKSLARQIFTAVAFAHAHGVVHRDLKPGNIMLTDEGQIKILDFGLAKIDPAKQLTNGNGGAEELSRFSTSGLIVGTIAYMSPEQLRGEKLDYRSDIFSVGVILYKLLTGKNPFNRPSQAETIAAILSENVATLEALKETAPESSESHLLIVEKCLHKEKDARFQSAAEALVELDNAEILGFRSKPKNYPAFFVKAALAVLMIVTVLSVYLFVSNKRPKRTLAVLPVTLENVAADKEYLADGLTSSFIEKLSGLSDIDVKNENSITMFKGKTYLPQEAGKQLKVDVVLIGAIKNRPDGRFLVVNLVRVSDGFALNPPTEWKIEENNLIKLQEEVTNLVIDKLKSNLTEADKNRLARKDTESEQAKDWYLKGRFYLKRRGDGDAERAFQFFRDAKELDRNFAKAWAGLAEAYLALSSLGVKSTIPPEKAVGYARQAANEALKLDETLSESYNALGSISLKYDWDWVQAENHFRMAIQRDPEFLPPHFGLLTLLRWQGRFDEAIEQARIIKELDPLSITSDLEIARTYYRKRDYETADKILSDLHEVSSGNKRVIYLQTYLFLNTGRIKEAADLLGELYQSDNQQDKIYAAAPYGFALAKLGRKKEALKIIEDLNRFGEENYIPIQEKALIHVGLGDKRKVFETLKKACDERFQTLPGWITDPVVDEIKTDPRFTEIKNCVRL